MQRPDNPWYYYYGDRLIKKPKPFLSGSQVHLKNWSGCYTVHSTNVHGFVIRKNRQLYRMPWDEFACLKGEGNSPEAMIKRGIKRTLNYINDNMNSQKLLVDELTGILKDLRK